MRRYSQELLSKFGSSHAVRPVDQTGCLQQGLLCIVINCRRAHCLHEGTLFRAAGEIKLHSPAGIDPLTWLAGHPRAIAALGPNSGDLEKDLYARDVASYQT